MEENYNHYTKNIVQNLVAMAPSAILATCSNKHEIIILFIPHSNMKLRFSKFRVTPSAES
jgi:hypothetical protein